MGDEDFFGAPPAAEEPAIILGAPPAEEEAPAADEEPIVLGAPEPTDDSAFAEAPVVDTLVATSGEPTPMQKWNEEWQQTLLERKNEDDAKKAELAAQAQADLAQFAKEREMKRETKMTKNREDEQAKLEAIEADLENDNSWQKVCKMVELSHDSKEKAEDTKRMRDILIHLKNDGAKAETLV